MCVSCRLVALWCVGGVIERDSSPSRPCCVSVEAAEAAWAWQPPGEWNAEFDGVWQHVFHALVRDGLMQRTAARVGCVGHLHWQAVDTGHPQLAAQIMQHTLPYAGAAL